MVVIVTILIIMFFLIHNFFLRLYFCESFTTFFLWWGKVLPSENATNIPTGSQRKVKSCTSRMTVF